MTKIGIDCDEVISETIDEILKRGIFKDKNISKSDITSYFLRDIPKLNMTKEDGVKEFFGFFGSDDYFQTKPVPGALEKLKELKEQGYELYVVTARSEQFKERTIKRINENFEGIFSGFLFMNQFKENEVPKSKLCKDFGIKLLIDDSVNNILDINKEGIPGILLDKPWNAGIEDNKLIKRCKSRDDVDVSYFLK